MLKKALALFPNGPPFNKVLWNRSTGSTDEDYREFVKLLLGRAVFLEAALNNLALRLIVWCSTLMDLDG